MENFVGEDGVNRLLATLESIAPLPPAFYQRLEPMLLGERLPKNTRLLREGEIARRVYFIAKGLVRAWYLDADSRQCTCWFMKEGDVMISVYSFFTGAPSHENITLFEDSELYSITRRQLETLYHEFPVFNLHGRELTQKYYIWSEARSIMLRKPKVKDRYETLLQLEPGLVGRVPMTLIASYLGTTKETLSRIRSGLIVDLRQRKA